MDFGLGPTTIHRILNAGAIKPHKVVYWCGKSPHQEFEEKQAAIVWSYMAPPENALVLTVDEKSQIQALDRSQPELTLRPGNPKRQTAFTFENTLEQNFLTENSLCGNVSS